ncbi:MAG: RnfABCDGE type electron transport complex subunit D [bacterium]|nr:RnfABCDGE type electron transport complex subunit D [bacterium]
MKQIEQFLSSHTMYRLMLYFLRTIIGAAVVLSFFDVLPYTWWLILVQYTILVGLCWGANHIFAYLAKTKPNYESAPITGSILTLIIGPITKFDLASLVFLCLVSLLAVASKYLLVVNKRHIFNPAAFGVLAAYLIIGRGASWWVGGQYLLPIILLGGFLVIQKIKHWHLIASFLGSYLGLTILTSLLQGGSPEALFTLLRNIFLISPLLFFTFVMLPEPLTGPQDKILRIYYGAVIGFFLVAFQNFLAVPYTLELALLSGNVFARIINPDLRISLHLKRKEKIDTNVYNFWFEPEKKFEYVPGQFLEYTLPHSKSDSRGQRRFFTIAAAPNEKDILISTRITDEKGSSFKKALLALEPGDEIVASRLEGRFVLPADASRKLAFIAGGIGITPFRAMAKHLLANKLYRDVILLYSNKTANDVAFAEIFDKAAEFGLKTIYVNTDSDGFIDAAKIKKEIVDWQERDFYISGPEPMVQAFEKILAEMSLPRTQIKRDYFPGYSDKNE